MHINPNNRNSQGISFYIHIKIFALVIIKYLFHFRKWRQEEITQVFVLKITQVKNYFQLQFKIWVRNGKNYLEK